MRTTVVVSFLLLAVSPASPVLAADWAPLKPIELIVPAGAGGGGDQMARLIQEIVTKHQLAPHPIVVRNMPGNSGADGFLLIKSNRRNKHQLIITLSNLFATRQATGLNFNWRDVTPVGMLALDQFVLWVNAESPYRSAKEYIDAVRAAPGTFRMGGTGSLQEDEIVTRQLARAAGVKFKYVALRGGGEVTQALAEKSIDSSLSNPIEALTLWRQGKLRPLGVFDSHPMEYPEQIAGKTAWGDIPTMRDQGYKVEYLMLRGIFAAPDVPDDVRQYYVNLLSRVSETPEWQAYLKRGALKSKFLTGNAFKSWLTFAEASHQSLLSRD